MAPTTTSPLIITLFLLFSISLKSHCFKITTQLIHRDSYFSPLYNATATTADRPARIIEATLARYVQLISSYDDRPLAVDIVAPGIWGIRFNIFYVNFSIGDPPVPQLAVMDTSSDLLWVKCPPCSPWGWPWSPKHCKYKIDYAGGHSSEGVYATEQLTFQTSNNGFVTTIPKAFFDCSSKQSGSEGLDPHVNGVLGLMAGAGGDDFPDGQFPLVTRLGTSFSYCVGSLSDRYYPHSHLSFGDAVDLIGGSTPLYLEEGRYFVHLSDISLGGKMLDIKKEVFTKMALRKKIEMDSGSELFLLYTEAFEVLKEEIERLAFWELMTPVLSPPSPLELCYKGMVEKEARGFPAMGIRFVGGVELVVDRFGVFFQVKDDVFCLAIVRSKGVSVIGMMVQQGYNVGYDLKAMTVDQASFGDRKVHHA
ncbi:unnamed protein product [Linum tenue]|uniref:Peptidase A1 domain-containing protein n=1 Tax=Linum tenue TaxID=586396 RepID=A0AAV0HZH1_9ROSI|nr:unnamed protein product [Linum tenue]